MKTSSSNEATASPYQPDKSKAYKNFIRSTQSKNRNFLLRMVYLEKPNLAKRNFAQEVSHSHNSTTTKRSRNSAYMHRNRKYLTKKEKTSFTKDHESSRNQTQIYPSYNEKYSNYSFSSLEAKRDSTYGMHCSQKKSHKIVNHKSISPVIDTTNSNKHNESFSLKEPSFDVSQIQGSSSQQNNAFHYKQSAPTVPQAPNRHTFIPQPPNHHILRPNSFIGGSPLDPPSHPNPHQHRHKRDYEKENHEHTDIRDRDRESLKAQIAQKAYKAQKDKMKEKEKENGHMNIHMNAHSSEAKADAIYGTPTKAPSQNSNPNTSFSNPAQFIKKNIVNSNHFFHSPNVNTEHSPPSAHHRSLHKAMKANKVYAKANSRVNKLPTNSNSAVLPIGSVKKIRNNKFSCNFIENYNLKSLEHFDKGKEELNARNYQDAIEYFTLAYKYDSNNIDAKFYRGVSFLDSQKPLKAITVIRFYHFNLFRILLKLYQLIRIIKKSSILFYPLPIEGLMI
jgi:hypothetical protein